MTFVVGFPPPPTMPSQHKSLYWVVEARLLRHLRLRFGSVGTSGGGVAVSGVASREDAER